MAIHPLLPHSRPRRLFGHVATMCGVGAVALGLLAPGLLGSGLLGSGLLASGPTRVQAVPRTVNQQRIFVSVVDKEGVPTPTLTPDDLTIKEDGRSREVLTVEPATEAMQIALLVDTSAVTTTAIRDIRLGLRSGVATEIRGRGPVAADPLQPAPFGSVEIDPGKTVRAFGDVTAQENARLAGG